MLAGIIRGILMFVLILLFSGTTNYYVMMASALFMGALAAHRLGWGGALAFLVFGFFFATNIPIFDAQGARMTNFFFPWFETSIGDGALNFLFLVVIGAYFVYELERMMDYIEELRENAA